MFLRTHVHCTTLNLSWELHTNSAKNASMVPSLRNLSHIPLSHNSSINYLVTYLTICSYHVTYISYSESTLCSYLDIRELLARNRCDIWKLSGCNGIQIHSHLVCKWTLNHLATLVVEETYSCIIYSQLQIIFKHHQMLNLNTIHSKCTTPF